MKRLAFVYTSIFIFSLCGKNVLAQGAAGLHNPVFGASALAQGNAFVARADDASAIQFNPAGLTQLQRPQVSQGASFILPSVEYHGNGVNEDMDTNIGIIPNIYFASPIIRNKLAAGLGITVPYGLDGKWDDDGFSRFVITDFDLRIFNINPTLTFKPFSFLSIGAGLDYYYADSEQDKLVPSPVFTGASEGSQELDMHGDAFGYNAGILYNITPKQSIGISFRSKADIDFKGKLNLSDLTGVTATVFDSNNFDSRTTTTATIPEMLSFGYAYKHGDSWSIEADIQWTNWSRFDVLEFDFKQANSPLGANAEDIRKWHNTWSFGLGGEYKVNEDLFDQFILSILHHLAPGGEFTLNQTLKVRGGYTFHESPVPSETFEPSIPQSSRHGLFTGLGYSWGKNLNKWIDFAYGTVFYENRKIENSIGDAFGTPADGRYDLITHIIAVNFNYRF